MIREIYVDNFRCLTNFRIVLKPFQLWLGENGSGKTTVRNALQIIQQLVAGGHVDDVFPETSLTIWDTKSVQTFGVKLDVAGEEYEYELVIAYQRGGGERRIEREQLKWKGETFFLFAEGVAHLFRINAHNGKVEEATHFSADWRRSVMPSVAERRDNAPLLRFREEVGRWLIVQPVPLTVVQHADAEARALSEHAENFAQWYRHLVQESPGIGYRARQLLGEVLPGFDELSLRESGETRRLRATFRTGGQEWATDFARLSDGQRQLIVLYTVLEALREKSFSVLVLDEPDNFVSLREIQPLVAALQEVCDDTSQQAVIISHHPEIINELARGSELWFSRKDGAHVVTGPLPVTPGLTPAETVARGWENE